MVLSLGLLNNLFNTFFGICWQGKISTCKAFRCWIRDSPWEDCWQPHWHYSLSKLEEMLQDLRHFGKVAGQIMFPCRFVVDRISFQINTLVQQGILSSGSGITVWTWSRTWCHNILESISRSLWAPIRNSTTRMARRWYYPSWIPSILYYTINCKRPRRHLDWSFRRGHLSRL